MKPTTIAVKALAAEGMTVAEIAQSLDINPITVKSHQKQFGIEIVSDTEKKLAAITRMATGGMSIEEIAQSLNIVTQTVRKLAKSEGIRIPRKPRAIDTDFTARRLAICEMFQKGNHTLQEVGDAFGLTRERIRQILEKHGIDERYKWTFTSNLDVAYATDLYRFGYSWEEITAELGCPLEAQQVIRPAINPTRQLSRERRISQIWRDASPTSDPLKCWNWSGTLAGCDGNRPRVVWKGRPHYAYIVTYYLHNGHWPSNWVLHRCDNPKCVNPGHLYEGTPLENARDRDTRGRSAKARGTASRRFTKTQVREIRDLIGVGISQLEIAKYTGFTYAAVNNIATGKTHREKISPKG